MHADKNNVSESKNRQMNGWSRDDDRHISFLRSGSRLTCKFHSGAHFVLAIGMKHSGTGPYRCTIPDFIIIIICE
jgi:hypothetical protein